MRTFRVAIDLISHVDTQVGYACIWNEGLLHSQFAPVSHCHFTSISVSRRVPYSILWLKAAPSDYHPLFHSIHFSSVFSVVTVAREHASSWAPKKDGGCRAERSVQCVVSWCIRKDNSIRWPVFIFTECLTSTAVGGGWLRKCSDYICCTMSLCWR
jgi:hypothetical protein